MKQMLTPKYDHEKIANPSLADLIDVFEDAWKGYILVPAQVLLNTDYGDIAAMTLLCPYFESIEALHRGKSSDNRSKEFFIAGFQRVFEEILGPADEQAARNAAEAIYVNVRNGVAHTGFPKDPVHFQRIKPKAFFLTYPLSGDGQLDTTKPVRSIFFNAQRIHDTVNWHLEHYVKTLRQPHETVLRDNFNHLMRSEWGIGKGDNVFGMTEKEFASFK
ncbi:MAG: hypothetical protein OXF79_24320 [Chloroflexi bacterium]|nr:hypothetical protein [Chloroflexota bacterium]